MSNTNSPRLNRRSILKSSLALLAGGAVGKIAEAEPEIKNANLASSPSSLEITNMRYAVIVKPGPSPCVLIRIDTNQGIYGLGEVRDVAGPQYAMVLKSRLLGENPLRIDYSVPENSAVWRRRSPGRRSLRGGDGALGHHRQGLQHPGISNARRKMAR